MSGDWEEMSKLFQNIDSHNFRRKRPIVGIMGAGLSERYSRSPFLDEMQSCIVGSSLLCRFSETPLGNPLLNIDYPLMSGISINHLWYWYKLLLTKLLETTFEVIEFCEVLAICVDVNRISLKSFKLYYS